MEGCSDLDYSSISENGSHQTHMLEAIKYLNVRIADNTCKAKNENTNEVNDILESQAMIK